MSSRVSKLLLVPLLAVMALPACQRSGPRSAAAPDSTAQALADSLAVRKLVVDFGAHLQQVSLLAPDTTVIRSIRVHYGPYVAPLLLRTWIRNPQTAPGRQTSSPWPDRIDARNFSRKSERVFLVDGDVVERTSADAGPGGEADRIPVQLTIWKMGPHWLITQYEAGARTNGSASGSVDENDPALAPAAAAEVVRAYYRAINARKYADAYILWEAGGAASGKGLVEFLNGFAQTKSVDATVGPPGPVGAAAGSRYVEVPVSLVATTMRGAREKYAGTYTLRRSVVDGATRDQRKWQIYSATMHRESPA